MRSRPLFVRHAPLRSTARALGRARERSGILGPLLIAVTLAFAGHQVGNTASAGTPVTTEVAAAGFTLERPERAAPPVAGPRQTRANVIARKVPTKTKAKPKPRRTVRASRSGRRAAAPRRSGWVRPSGGPLTSHYGPRWGRLHKGIDLGAAYGSPIYAASAGVVTYAGQYGGYGRLVTIRHEGGYVTAYGHMASYAVRSGQRVSAGQVIAYVGSAGRSTGPHLHFEVRSGGAFLNPLPFLRARGVYV